MKRKWSFVLATGLSPEVFEEMTIDDYNAAYKVMQDMNKKKGG